MLRGATKRPTWGFAGAGVLSNTMSSSSSPYSGFKPRAVRASPTV